MTRFGESVSVAAAFVWLGMVLAISFLEAPLKFRAPGITLPLGLGIGRLVFRAMNGCEALLAGALLLGSGLGRSPVSCLTVAAALAAVLVVQVVGLRPGLDRRAQRIIAGADRTPSRRHVSYIVVEVVKVVLLLDAGTVVVAGAMTPSAVAREDLRDRGGVEALVRGFYCRAFAGPLLGPVFVDIARMDLAARLPITCHFWETVLFRAGTYRRNAFTVHGDPYRRAGLTSAHFARWLALWAQTVDDLYAGPAADRAKVQAARIADSIHRRLRGTSNVQPLSVGTSPSTPLGTVVRTRAGAPGGGSHQPTEAGNTRDHRTSGDRERKRSR